MKSFSKRFPIAVAVSVLAISVVHAAPLTAPTLSQAQALQDSATKDQRKESFFERVAAYDEDSGWSSVLDRDSSGRFPSLIISKDRPHSNGS